MLKRFFQCLSLMMVLTLAIFGTAAAKSKAELTSINAYDLNDEILRIEILFDGKLKTDNVTNRTTENILTISMENTTPGRISQIAGTKIEDTDELIKRITVKEMEISHTIARITLDTSISEEDYTVTVKPANRSQKESARVIVDIFKDRLDYQRKEKTDDDEENFSAFDKVIVLDPGHGGSDSGAIGLYGTKEKDVALAVGLKAERLLKDAGFKVIMTRKTDIDVASPNASNVAELQSRVNKIPPQANVFISIHCNAFSKSTSHGMETYYHLYNEGGQHLAQLLNEELEKNGGLLNRGVKAANFYVIKRAPCPASLVELGFITNPDEEVLLDDDNYQKLLAEAIANAVKRFFME